VQFQSFLWDTILKHLIIGLHRQNISGDRLFLFNASDCYNILRPILKTRVGNQITIKGRMNCALSLACRKVNYFILKLYLYLTMKKSGFSYYLSTCLSWSFVLKRCCAPTWLTKILMRTTSNVHAGHRFPTPVLNGRVNGFHTML